MDQHDAPGPDANPFWGRMNDPSGSAVVVGLCGDDMEFYLDIRDEIIAQVLYYTNGCADTRMCGRAAAERARGRPVMDALAINPREIIDSLPQLSGSGRHCAILAVATLHRAVADFLLKP